MGFVTRPDTNRSVQSQKKARRLKFVFKKKWNHTVNEAKTKVLVSRAVTNLSIVGGFSGLNSCHVQKFSTPQT